MSSGVKVYTIKDPVCVNKEGELDRDQFKKTVQNKR
jgi:hypothetical protein